MFIDDAKEEFNSLLRISVICMMYNPWVSNILEFWRTLGGEGWLLLLDGIYLLVGVLLIVRRGVPIPIRHVLVVLCPILCILGFQAPRQIVGKVDGRRRHHGGDVGWEKTGKAHCVWRL